MAALRSIDPAWWDRATWQGQPLRDLLAARAIGPVFRFLHSRGWSYAAIAEATDLGAGRVSEIASRNRAVATYDVLVRIADGLQIPRSRMGLGYGEGSAGHRGSDLRDDHALEDPVQRRSLIGALASVAVGAIPDDLDRWLPVLSTSITPAKVTRQEVAAVRAFTQLHRKMQAASGGGACRESALGYLSWARAMLSAEFASEEVEDGLKNALADLHNLVGWLSHDLDRHTDARRHLTQGLLLAREANNLTLMADSYYRLGRISLHLRQADEALHLFGLGQLVAQDSGCLASVAILHANEAWAYAMQGRPAQVRDALARAQGELDRIDPATAPAWTRFFTAPADLHGLTGVIYGALAAHDEHRTYAATAAEHSLQAVRLRRAGENRSFTFDLIAVATAHALDGQLDGAEKYARRALKQADDVRSARVHDRLRGMWQIAGRHSAGHPGLADVGARIKALQAA
jgi:tetratricopeptide (TPR) repeat protein